MDRGFFIDGEWRKIKGSDVFQILNPATGQRIGSTALGTAETIDQAVNVASLAFPKFSKMSANERAEILLKAADNIELAADKMAELLTKEQGKPKADNLKEIIFGAEVLRYYAGEATRIYGSIRPASSPNIRNLVNYHPVGVAGAIVPWNYPIDLYCWKIAPAIAAGCPIIVKSPHETPLAITMLVDCIHQAGMPNGCLADIPGLGPIAGDALARHPKIRILSATASIAAGQSITRASAGNLKKLCLELGGHAPFIVMPDADLKEAAMAAHRRSFSNMGQICITVNRILVHNSCHKEFVSILEELTTNTIVGDGLDKEISYGPVLNSSVSDRVENQINDAISKGGRLISGGFKPTEKHLINGNFFRPTLIDNTPLDSLPMIEESYGPLAAIASFETENEMLEIANGLEYGLAAYIYGNDLEKVWLLAENLDFGAIGINVNDTSELQAPFGGWKMSGVGRELGPEGLMSYLEPKHLKMKLGNK